MTLDRAPSPRHRARRLDGEPPGADLAPGRDLEARRAVTSSPSLTPQAVLHLQRTAGNRAASASVQRMCGLDSSKIQVEDSALKHKVELAGAPAAFPTVDQVKRQFHVQKKYGAPKQDDRDPSSMKIESGGLKIVYKQSGNSIKVFHFHAYGYEGDRS